jgi:quercetin dioxygenase-like cupin family protein
MTRLTISGTLRYNGKNLTQGGLFMQKTRPFRQTVLGLTVLGWSSWLLFNPVHAEDSSRFVRPEQATTYIEPQSKSQIKVLIDERLGGTKDVSIADLVIPPGVDVPDHVHQSTEIFYILSGELEQTSEGKVQKLTAGMACVVPANTTTHHKVTSKEPVHALVIWAPGGEEKRITEQWSVKTPEKK